MLCAIDAPARSRAAKPSRSGRDMMLSFRGLDRCSALFGLVAVRRIRGRFRQQDRPDSRAGRTPISSRGSRPPPTPRRISASPAVDFKVPSDWKLNLQTELIESLVAQGYKAFGIFPGDAVGINSTVAELKSARHSRRSRSPAARRTRPMSPSASAPTSTIPPISARRS